MDNSSNSDNNDQDIDCNKNNDYSDIYDNNNIDKHINKQNSNTENSNIKE